MVKPWDGRERRTPTLDGREGRRPTDRHCAQHDVLWTHHDKDTEEHRGLVCGKILEVKTSLAREVERLERVDEALRKVDEALDQKVEILKTTIVGKYWFRVVIGGLCAALLYIAAQNRFSNIEQTDTLKNLAIGQKEIIVVVNNIENKQIEVVQKIKAFESEIEQISKRQDVLRDAHMKIMQEKK